MGLAWGPAGHEWVTERALDSLNGRFKILQNRHRAALVGRAMSADYRKDKDLEEASRHFVDMERYGRDLFMDPETDPIGWCCSLEGKQPNRMGRVPGRQRSPLTASWMRSVG